MDAPWIAVAAADALATGAFISVTAAGQRYLLANVDGVLYAVEDNCSHEDFPLAFGCLEGARIKCSLHGSRFDLASGAACDEPAITPLRTYRLMVAEGQLWLHPDSSAAN